ATVRSICMIILFVLRPAGGRRSMVAQDLLWWPGRTLASNSGPARGGRSNARVEGSFPASCSWSPIASCPPAPARGHGRRRRVGQSAWERPAPFRVSRGSSTLAWTEPHTEGGGRCPVAVLLVGSPSLVWGG